MKFKAIVSSWVAAALQFPSVKGEIMPKQSRAIQVEKECITQVDFTNSFFRLDKRESICGYWLTNQKQKSFLQRPSFFELSQNCGLLITQSLTILCARFVRCTMQKLHLLFVYLINYTIFQKLIIIEC